MKIMIDGIWHANATDSDALRAQRAAPKNTFRRWVGSRGDGAFPAVAGRYHLYVSYACPWAHRVILGRKLKGLEAAIPMSILDPWWGGPEGWIFGDGTRGDVTPDALHGYRALHQIYRAAVPDFTGKVTVPVLWDTETATIVNNESADILRMLDQEFDAYAAPKAPRLYPAELAAEIDALNDFVQTEINLGVYRAGFASGQAAYDSAVVRLFDALDRIEARLTGRRFLVGERLTEADLRLFTTLVRFDTVYHGALRCNLRRLADYPALWAHTRHVYAQPGVAATVKLDHVKRHYYDDLPYYDRTIVPAGPLLDFAEAA